MRKLKIFKRRQTREKRKLNIIVKGLSDDQMETDKIEIILKQMLGLTNLGVTESIRLDNSGLIKMKIKSMEKKLEIRKNKYKLAGTDIFIKDDKSYEERKID